VQCLAGIIGRGGWGEKIDLHIMCSVYLSDFGWDKGGSCCTADLLRYVYTILHVCVYCT
jgi:hypothetical protein